MLLCQIDFRVLVDTSLLSSSFAGRRQAAVASPADFANGKNVASIFFFHVEHIALRNGGREGGREGGRTLEVEFDINNR
jgi:hypothetical protein